MPADDAASAAALPMVLVVGTDDWAIDQAAAGLVAAGHVVSRCQTSGDPPFPCFGVRPEAGCPLDQGVEVVLTVRNRTAAQPAPLEMGVVCGLHRRLPLVLAGMVSGDPYEPFAAARVEPHEDPAVACRAAAALRPAPTNERTLA